MERFLSDRALSRPDGILPPKSELRTSFEVGSTAEKWWNANSAAIESGPEAQLLQRFWAAFAAKFEVPGPGEVQTIARLYMDDEEEPSNFRVTFDMYRRLCGSRYTDDMYVAFFLRAMPAAIREPVVAYLKTAPLAERTLDKAEELAQQVWARYREDASMGALFGLDDVRLNDPMVLFAGAKPSSVPSATGQRSFTFTEDQLRTAVETAVNTALNQRLHAAVEAAVKAALGSKGPGGRSGTDRPWCVSCQAHGHTMDNCYELHPERAPAGWKSKRKGVQIRPPTALTTQQPSASAPLQTQRAGLGLMALDNNFTSGGMLNSESPPKPPAYLPDTYLYGGRLADDRLDYPNHLAA
jgi:hypothetical protein